MEELTAFLGKDGVEPDLAWLRAEYLVKERRAGPRRQMIRSAKSILVTVVGSVRARSVNQRWKSSVAVTAPCVASAERASRTGWVRSWVRRDTVGRADDGVKVPPVAAGGQHTLSAYASTMSAAFSTPRSPRTASASAAALAAIPGSPVAVRTASASRWLVSLA